MRAAVAVALVALAVLCSGCGGGAAAPAAGQQQRPFLWQCEQIHIDQAKAACYIRLLLQDIDQSGDPANELPQIDWGLTCRGTALFRRRHLLMHRVGRPWARGHHLTRDRLQAVVPRSNDPGCSAGFGMGMVMYLGPEIISTGGKGAARTCSELPTRYRQFTCVHSLGHALMRGYHETLFLAVHACEKLGPAYTPDCAQGVFHDYWIALHGAGPDDIAPSMQCARRESCARVCALRARLLVPLLRRADTGAVDRDRGRSPLERPRARRGAARRLHRRRLEDRARRSPRTSATVHAARTRGRRARVPARGGEPGLRRGAGPAARALPRLCTDARGR